MSGIGPAMDMAMETARDERAAVRAAASDTKAAQAAATSVHAVGVPQATAGATAESGRADASTVRTGAQSPNPTPGTPAAGSASTSDDGPAGTPRSTTSTDASTPAVITPAPSHTTATQADSSVGTAPGATTASISASATPAKTFATTQAARPAPAASPADAGSLGGTVFALLLVVGLILALGWLAKRMPGFGRGASNNGLRMVASLPIGARERVVVVEVGTTQLLLGVGPGGTRTLHTLEQPLPEAGPTQAPQFAQLLAQHFGKKA